MIKILVVFLSIVSLGVFAQESVCSKVKIQINQELTLERQAFEATMEINNGLVDASLTDVSVSVNFLDAENNPILATDDADQVSSPDNDTPKFFIRVNSKENIDDVEGQGIVGSSSTAVIKWLIIPSKFAGGENPDGTQYKVGATLTFKVKGEERTIEVIPDTIFVKPMPDLQLDYFIPEDVYGDDPFTQEIEPSVPFSLGVRVKNNGFGPAKNLKINSGQPRIIENEQGLLVNYKIIGSEVDGQAATNSLLVDFGDIAALSAGNARWKMTSSLSGSFEEFSASFTHADELGGELTSLIGEIKTHHLVRDILVDLSGRDQIRDFLAFSDNQYSVYESNGNDFPVTNQSANLSLLDGVLSRTPQQGFIYGKILVDASYDGKKITARRSDGKIIVSDNIWLSKKLLSDGGWEYYLNIFDYQADVLASDETYELSVTVDESLASITMSGVTNKVVEIGEPVSMNLTASVVGISGANPVLSFRSISPTDASFSNGTFSWTPDKEGTYVFTFYAKYNNLVVNKTARISVVPSEAPEISFNQSEIEVIENQEEEDILIKLSHPSKDEVTVNYTVTSSDADFGIDYTLTDGQAVFTPGETEFNIRLLLNDDQVAETLETLTITLDAVVNATIAFENQVTIKIIDDDQLGNLLVKDDHKLVLFEKSSGKHLNDVEHFTLDNIGSFTYGIDNKIYISSKSTGSILRFNSTDGSFVDEFSVDLNLGKPNKILFGPDNKLYVSNELNNTLITLDSNGDYIETVVEGLLANSDFTFTASGILLVTDELVLRELDLTGQQIGVDIAIAGLNHPEAIEFGPDGFLYIANTASNNLLKVDYTNKQVVETYENPAFSEPISISFSEDGTLFITNRGSSSVINFNADTGMLISDDITQDFVHTNIGQISSVGLKPEIKSQPSDINIIVGSIASFSVRAYGTSHISYQWYKDDVLIPEAVTPEYSFEMDNSTQSASYYCVVTNYKGSAVSNTVQLISGATLIGLSNGDIVGIDDVEFNWTDVGASEYQVLLGTSQGSSDIESHTGLTSLNVIASNLTFNGGQFWLRLRSFSNDEWSENDYLFTTEIVNHTVNFISGANGSIAPVEPQTIVDGGSTSLVTATANTGYEFIGWSNGVSTSDLLISDVRGDLTLTANFAVKVLNVTFDHDDNGLIVGDSVQNVNYGENTTAVTAEPLEGYEFIQWSDGSIENPRTISNVTENLSVTAQFALKTYNVLFNTDVNGVLSGDANQVVLHGSDSTAVEAVPNTGYHFTQWNDGNTNNPRTILNVTANSSLIAQYEINEYTVTFLAGLHGTLSGDTVLTVTHGNSAVAPNVTAQNGWVFTGWDIEFNSVTSNISVTALYMEDNAPVAVTDSYEAVSNEVLSINTSNGVLANDSLGDGGALTAVLETDVSNGVLTLSSDGSFEYAPNIDFEGIDSFTYKAFDGVSHSNSVLVQITVSIENNTELKIEAYGTVLNLPVLSYDSSQDFGDEAQITENGSTVTLTGNSWKAIDLTSIEISSDTVLEVTFSSSNEGEIHGIGFDTDLSISDNRTFALFGTQNWGLRDYSDYASPDSKTYKIPVGEFYTGSFRYLFFVCDEDVQTPVAESVFKDIIIRSNSAPQVSSDAFADNENITLPENTIVHIEATDADGDELTYEWSKISGPGIVTFASQTAADSTVSFELPGIYELAVSVSDGFESTSSTVSINVNHNPADLLSIDINGSSISLPIITYDPNQDNTGTANILNTNQTLFLKGNVWKAVDLSSVNINEDTVLEVEFLSNEVGEIHGIGFDTNLSICENSTFKLLGTQNWGIPDFANATEGVSKLFKIPVGQFYTGNYRYLVFVCDEDVEPPLAESTFTGVKIYDNVSPEITVNPYTDNNSVTLPAGTSVHVEAIDADNDVISYSWTKASGPGNVTFSTSDSADSIVNFSESGEYVLQVSVADEFHTLVDTVTIAVTAEPGTELEVDVYGSELSRPVMAFGNNQDGEGTSSISLDAKTLTLNGNKWKVIDLDSVNITEDTILEVTFSSDSVGEIHGIGFDNDLAESSNRIFKFTGSQQWGLEDFNNYLSPEPKLYRIPVGQFYTGNYRYLVFVCDDDTTNPDSKSVFSSIKIIDRSEISENSEAGVVADNLGESIESITVYADADENIYSEWLIDSMADISVFERADASHNAYSLDAFLGPIILKDFNGLDFNNDDEFNALVEVKLAIDEDPAVISYNISTDAGDFIISYVIGTTGNPVISGQEVLIPIDVNRDSWEGLIFDLEADLLSETGFILLEVDSIEFNGIINLDNIAFFKTVD